MPFFSTAALSHQMSNYRAARVAYEEAIWAHPAQYFFGLEQLRNIACNLSLPTTPDLYSHILKIRSCDGRPEINLPFSMLFGQSLDIKQLGMLDQSSDFTSVLSHVYLPFLMRAALADEILASLRALQQRAPPPLLLKKWSTTGPNVLDKQMAFGSILTWRLTLIHEFLTLPESLSLQAHTPIRESQVRAFHFCLRNFSLAGATAKALKLMYTVRIARLKITKQNLPRIAHFMKIHRETNDFLQFRQAYQLFLYDFHIPSDMSKPWIKAMSQLFLMSPSLVDCQSLFQKIGQEFNVNFADRGNDYLALMLALVRSDRANESFFVKSVLSIVSGQIPDGLSTVLFRWLPQILSVCKEMPGDILTNLFRANPAHFMLSAQHTRVAGAIDASLDEALTAVSATKDGSRISRENDAVLRWLAECADDIAKLATAVEAHLRLYTALAFGPRSSIEDLAAFCVEHRPVFVTKVKIPALRALISFKFPLMAHPIAQFSLVCDGVNEARIRLIPFLGKTRDLSLVSPKIYRFAQTEHLFVGSIAKWIDRHPSSRCRSRFIAYPSAFLLDAELLLAFTTSLYGQGNLADPALPRLLAEVRGGEDTESPAALAERDRAVVDRTFWFGFVSAATGGSKMNFLFMRQSLVAHMGAFLAFHFIFGAKLPLLPSLCLAGDRMRCYLPGFMNSLGKGLPQMPLTQSVRLLFPEYVLRGTFSTSWQTIADVLAAHLNGVRLHLMALMPRVADAGEVLERTRRMASCEVTAETDKPDEPFPFALVDHLIGVSSDSLLSQPYAYSWI
jgi:hypothetical protein